MRLFAYFEGAAGGGSGHRNCPFRGGFAWKWRTILQGLNDCVCLHGIQLCFENTDNLKFSTGSKTYQTGDRQEETALNKVAQTAGMWTRQASPQLPPSLILCRGSHRGHGSLPRLHNQPSAATSDTC